MNSFWFGGELVEADDVEVGDIVLVQAHDASWVIGGVVESKLKVDTRRPASACA